jgi:hypothetical protein
MKTVIDKSCRCMYSSHTRALYVLTRVGSVSGYVKSTAGLSVFTPTSCTKALGGELHAMLFDEVDGRGVAVFARGYGVCLVYFAHVTLPSYIERLDNTVLTFGYAPFSHFPPLGHPSPVALWLLQRTLLFAGTSLAIGLLPRCALCLSTLALLHVLALDRIVYNNHYVLMIELCALLLAADERCLAWPLRSRRAVLPYWQLLSLQLLVLTPYFYGGLAKLNRSWLLDAEPVRTWADEMLGSMDDASGGHVAQALEHLARGATDAELLTAFAFFVSYAGLLIDLLVPLALLHRARWLRCSAALVALGFHACNRLWFGLGVFPYLCVLGLSLFLVGGQVHVVEQAAVPASRHPARPTSKPAESTQAVTKPAESTQAVTKPTESTQAVTKPAESTHRFAPRRRWPAVAVLALALLHCVLPFRHLWRHRGDEGYSSLWTEEGSLFAWHMKRVERSGWLALRVLALDTTQREWTLIPETDTALHPAQAGFLPVSPTMLLTYAQHLQTLYAARGVNVSVFAHDSCVSANGRPAQRLFVAAADLLEAAATYDRIWAPTGVGSFLHEWGATSPTLRCDLQPAADAEAVQRASDATFRWLYGHLLFSRPHKKDWPWRGRTRIPAGRTIGRTPAGAAMASCASDTSDAAAEGAAEPEGRLSNSRGAPAWARVSSFVHARNAIWTPVDAPPE